jgi:hypothetical protein
MPDDKAMGLAVARKVLTLLQQGARILMDPSKDHSPALLDDADVLRPVMDSIRTFESTGQLLRLPLTVSDLSPISLPRDLDIEGVPGRFAWSHRRSGATDIWFISNQTDQPQNFRARFSAEDELPEYFDPVTGRIHAFKANVSHGNTIVTLDFAPSQSCFLVFRKKNEAALQPKDTASKNTIPLKDAWSIRFDHSSGGPVNEVKVDGFQSWTDHPLDSIRYYSGTATYVNHFDLNDLSTAPTTLRLEKLFDIATVRINGIKCGTVWTAPYEIDIFAALKKGRNRIEIDVTNTWHNRLIYDESLPENKRITWTTAPFRLKGKPLLHAGLAAAPTFIRYASRASKTP